MKEYSNIILRTPEELEEYTNETQDLCYPGSDIIIEFQTKESQINDIDCNNLFLCKVENGIVGERFDFVGRDVKCWGTFVLRDFEGRCFDGGNFVGRDWMGRNGIMWNFEGRNIYYYAVFISYGYLRCHKIEGIHANSIHQSLTEEIEYIGEDFDYGIYSRF